MVCLNATSSLDSHPKVEIKHFVKTPIKLVGSMTTRISKPSLCICKSNDRRWGNRGTLLRSHFYSNWGWKRQNVARHQRWFATNQKTGLIEEIVEKQTALKTNNTTYQVMPYTHNTQTTLSMGCCVNCRWTARRQHTTILSQTEVQNSRMASSRIWSYGFDYLQSMQRMSTVGFTQLLCR